MKIFPAIDILGGKAVRLQKGDYGTAKQYSDDPVSVARSFYLKGAECIHIVDLDGAKDGKASNANLIGEIVRATTLYAEVGGGIRSEERIESYLSAGVGRVILGTVAVKNPDFVRDMVKKFGERIAVGVDVKDGFVAVSGWLETASERGEDFVKKMRDIGVKTVIYTDISKDGMLSGPNISAYESLNKIEGVDIVASGGITHIFEVQTLARMGTSGAILGKALYEGKIDLTEAVKAGKI